MQKIPLRHGPGLSAQARSDGKAASGRVGAQEPGYGRPPGECPPELGYGQPNRHGPEYEEGGRYPGARLDGVVPDGRTRHGVEHCADTCVGVRDVENHTRVARPEVPGAPGSPRH